MGESAACEQYYFSFAAWQNCSRRFETSQDSKLFGHLSASMGSLQQRDARRVELVGKRGITGRRKYADLLYCIPQRNWCRGCEITDSGGILRGVRKNLGAIVFDFSDGIGMGNIIQKGGPSGNLRISGRRLPDVGTDLTGLAVCR